MLSTRYGLLYMDMHFSPHLKIETFPHVVFTSDTTWDPSIADLEYIVEEMDILEDNHLTSATNDSRRDAYIEDYINESRSVDWMLTSRFQSI
jgi:hypothetical protein